MHNTLSDPGSRVQHKSERQWWAGPAALLTTLLALPASANIDIPNDPLTTGARVPPNILFILDDSGSMEWRYMYNPDIASVTNGGISSTPTGDNRTRDSSYSTTNTDVNALYDQNYVTNTLYYNPNTTYTPWLDSSGAQVAGGTTYGAAYSDNIYIAHASSGTSSSTTNLASNVQTFYAPRPNATSLTDARQYYRYQIRTDQRVVRSERLEATLRTDTTTGTLATSVAVSSRNGYSSSYLVPVPSGASNLQFWTTSSASCTGACADLYAQRNINSPGPGATCASAKSGSIESCSISSPQSGNWYVRLRAGSAFSGVNVHYSYETTELDNTGEASVGCDTTTTGWGWRNCTYATPATGAFPTGRTEAAERTNFATWYSFHRTRTKAAKAGASIAFNELDSQVRVGFRTIHGRAGGTGGNNPTQNEPIPVNYNQGLFDNPNGTSGTNNNRQRWYNRLFLAKAESGTPLRSALDNAGKYFSSRSETGAYGPESGADQLACRQNFSILTTDGFWNGDSNGFGGDHDGTEGKLITSPGGATYQYKPAMPYRDPRVANGTNRSHTLADVAMRYWKNDLVDMPNVVPTTTANPAFWQHMVTFGISIGLKGTLDQSSVQQVVADGGPRRGGVAVDWPTPAEDSVNNIDDLLHAAVNSRGTFLSAGNPQEFSDGLTSALAAIVERTGSFSNVAANSTALDAGSRVFQANYVSGVWVGEMRSQPVSLNGVETVDCSLPTQPINGWCASKGIPTTGRKVFTSDGHSNGAATTNGARGLRFPSGATTAQLASLERLAPLWQHPGTGKENAAYIAGDRTLELNRTGVLRNRNHLLGDIVGSSPAYVRDTNTLYVGANDGMLHAINATNGNEMFAFIPGIINWSDLGSLSRQDYGHRYFVDGPIVVTSRQQTPNANILVGALGKGGKGLFSLDVTNPATFGTSGFRWEQAETPLGNMGLVQGRPIISQVSTGARAVVIGNGVNSTHNKAVLLVLDLNSGEVIREIDTGVGEAATPNGLSAPTAVLGPDGKTVSYVYAGDMLGNVWKFDLTDESSDAWSVSKLFEAGVTRPISGAVTIAKHPQTQKRWIFFGTGRYLSSGDVTNTATQGMYGFIEDSKTLKPSDLTLRTLAVTTGTSSGYPVRAFESSKPLSSASKGWYINLPDSGERIVQDAQVVSSFLITASMIPTGDACESDGRGYINALGAFTGTSAGASYFDLDGDGATIDETIGGQPIGSVNVGVGMPTLPNLLRGMVVVGGSAGSDLGAPKTLAPRWERASWREVRRD